MTAINQTTKMMGTALRQVRISMHIPRSELAMILKISRYDLSHYEDGEMQLPIETMQMMFANAYMMLRAQYINRQYRKHVKQMPEQNASDNK